MALPRWTWRRALGEFVVALLVVYLTRHQPHPTVSIGFWGIFFAILTGIWNAFKTGAEITAEVVYQAFKWLKSRVFDLGRLFGSSLAFLGNGVKNLAGAIAGFVRDAVGPALKQLYDWAKQGIGLFQKGISKIIGWVQKVRGWIVGIYNTFLRPITDAIDKIRRALDILASLGLDAAGDLSRRLSDVERKIQQPFLDLLSKVNEVIGVLNKVMTANGLFQKLTLFGSLFENRITFTNFTINNVFKVKPKAPTTPDAPKTSAQLLDDNIAAIAKLAVRSTSDLDPATAEWVSDLQGKITRAA
jgi:hypothetical protein